MVEETAEPAEAERKADDSISANDKREVRTRKPVPGNLTYLITPGTLKAVLSKIITASKTDRFTQDYLATVLGFGSGSQKSVIPIMKRMGLLSSDGTPTEAYAKFRTDSGRPEAVLQALRTGFAELFKRNEHVYAADDKRLTDLILEITGLEKSDTVVKAIRGTFRTFTGFLPQGFTSSDVSQQPQSLDAEGDGAETPTALRREQPSAPASMPLGLSYQINIVLPETKDVEVYNSIFRSLRDNLLRS